MDRGKRRSGEFDSEEEEEEFKVEDLNEEISNSNKLSASNWKNRLKLLRNYSTLDNSSTVSVRNNNSSRSRGRRDHCYGFIIHPDNWSVMLI